MKLTTAASSYLPSSETDDDHPDPTTVGGTTSPLHSCNRLSRLSALILFLASFVATSYYLAATPIMGRRIKGGANKAMDRALSSANNDLYEDKDDGDVIAAEFGRRKGESKNALSGTGFDALVIPPGGNAVIKDGTYDASNIVGGDSFDKGGVGVFADEGSETTICKAQLIKGGQFSGDGGNLYGNDGVYAYEDSTVNIKNAYIEGGDAVGTDGGFGVFVLHDSNPSTVTVKIAGRHTKIRGGLGVDGDGELRQPAVKNDGGNVFIYEGTFGQKESKKTKRSPVSVLTRYDGHTVIAGGKFHGDIVINNGAQLVLYVKHHEKVVLPSGETVYKGKFCNGDKFEEILISTSTGATVDVRDESDGKPGLCDELFNGDLPDSPPTFAECD